MSDRYTIHVGDCLEVLRTLPDSSIDSVVCDPPYGIFFMGSKWDYDVPSAEVWAECLRVLKPGGHLLAFAGTRTQHRMAVKIEDAGFEIRDMIAWVYGSGFCKVGYIRDKGGEHVMPGFGGSLKPALEPITMARKPIGMTVAECMRQHGTGALNIDGCRVGETVETWPVSRGGNTGRSMAGGEMRVAETGAAPPGRWPANLLHDGSDEVLALFPDSNGSGRARTLNRGQREDGWGMADQPGALRDAGTGSAARFFQQCKGGHDEVWQDLKLPPESASTADGKRFIYCAKASKADRNAGCEALPLQVAGGMSGRRDGSMGSITHNNNTHPTVKPTDLMRYLCRLVTPPGGVVLDPFMGSGSTGKAAMLEGFKFIGIERDEGYAEIARARVAAAS